MIPLLKLERGWQTKMKFELTEGQLEKFKEWDSTHDCDGAAGAIGGKVGFKFIPTGLGMIFQAECICGEKLQLTESENW